MLKTSKFSFTVVAIVSCLLSLAGCASVWPVISGPHDIRVTSVTDVDFKDQPQLDWAGLQPRPSIILTRIEFTTNADLLALAKKRDYNVSYVFGPCIKHAVQDSGLGGGYVYSGKMILLPDTKETPEYAKAVAKGPPFSYQVYTSKVHSNVADIPMCLTLVGGNMMGGRIRSNFTAVPKANN